MQIFTFELQHFHRVDIADIAANSNATANLLLSIIDDNCCCQCVVYLPLDLGVIRCREVSFGATTKMQKTLTWGLNRRTGTPLNFHLVGSVQGKVFSLHAILSILPACRKGCWTVLPQRCLSKR